MSERNISDEAITKATGHTWDYWLTMLANVQAEKLNHKAIVAWLGEHGVDSHWWQQTITVAYEKQIGRRKAGETQDADYQIGVSRTLTIDSAELWERMTHEWLELWLGAISELPLKKGEQYQTKDGVEGEIRSVVDGKKIRLTHQEPGQEPTTLQLYLDGKGERTMLRFHQEKLADQTAREQMREHWKQVLSKIEQQL